jgi:hypothetical protein
MHFEWLLTFLFNKLICDNRKVIEAPWNSGTIFLTAHDGDSLRSNL